MTNGVPMKRAFPLLLLCSLTQSAVYTAGQPQNQAALLHVEHARQPGAVCPTGQPKDEAALAQVEHTWLRAAEQHDLVVLGCILANEFEEADSAGSLIDRAAMLASAANPRDAHYELADLHAHVYGDFAYVRGKGVRNDNGVRTAKSRFTDIFVYRQGRWQCVAGHESHFPEQR
jgi:hypothetical protein